MIKWQPRVVKSVIRLSEDCQKVVGGDLLDHFSLMTNFLAPLLTTLCFQCRYGLSIGKLSDDRRATRINGTGWPPTYIKHVWYFTAITLSYYFRWPHRSVGTPFETFDDFQPEYNLFILTMISVVSCSGFLPLGSMQDKIWSSTRVPCM